MRKSELKNELRAPLSVARQSESGKVSEIIRTNKRRSTIDQTMVPSAARKLEWHSVVRVVGRQAEGKQRDARERQTKIEPREIELDCKSPS
jgi:hypothetical protein